MKDAMTKLVGFIALVLFVIWRLHGFDAPPPLDVTWRPAAIGSSLVAQFHNKSNHQLTVKVNWQVSNSHSREEDEVIILMPGETKEQGWLEGWAFQHGDYVEVNGFLFGPLR